MGSLPFLSSRERYPAKALRLPESWCLLGYLLAFANVAKLFLLWAQAPDSRVPKPGSYDRNLKMTRVIAPLFLAIGLGAWSLSAYLYTDARELVTQGEHARGTVTSFTRSGSVYFPTVAFKTAVGTEFEFTGKTGTSSSRFVKGQQIDVVYRPEDPQDAKINTFLDLWAPALFVTIFGTIFSVIGFVSVVVLWKTRHTAADLRIHGTQVLADFERVAVNPAVSVNGASPYRIFVQWQDPASSEVHVFHSDDIWYDPEKFINRKQLTVYVDPRNLKRYSVDISFLPPAAT